MNLKFTISVNGFSHNQTDCTLSAETDNDVVGKIAFAIYKGEISINYIFVAKQIRHQGVASAMLKHLQSIYPDKEIDWGSLTDDGAALYQKTSFVDHENKEYTKKYNALLKLKDLETRFNEILNSVSDDKKPEWIRFHGDKWNRVNSAIDRLEDELRTMKPKKRLMYFS